MPSAKDPRQSVKRWARQVLRLALLLFPLLWLAGCSLLQDPGTRLGFAIEAGVKHLPAQNGSTYTIRYEPPKWLAKRGYSYSVQLDKTGALIVWYKDARGKVTESGTTTHHSRFVDTPKTYKIDKPGNSPLLIELKRENGRAVIVGVR
jgi:hypothetical protein